MLEWADKAGRFCENLMLGLLLGGMIVLASAQILLRELGLGSLFWGDEAVRLMVLWIAMVAGVAAAREDRHISIDVLSRFLPPRGQAFAALLVDLFTVAVCLTLAWYGSIMVRFALEDGDSMLGAVPAWMLQAIVPAAFLLMAWRYLVWVARRCRALVTGAQA